MQNSLRFRLIIILITLAIGPLVLVGAIVAQRSFTSQQNQAYDLQRQVAGNVSTEIESVFLGINNDLITMGNEIRNLENPDQAQQLSLMLSGISSGSYRDYYNELTLLDRNGREIVRISPTEIVPNNLLSSRADQNEFKQPVTTRDTYYGPITFKPNTGKAYITIAIPLFEPRSTTLNGVLVANIRLDAIGNVLGAVQVGENQTIYLTDASGHVVAHQDRTKDLAGDHIHLPRSVTTQTGLDGNSVVLAPDKIQLGDQALYVVAEKPVAVALALAYTIINTIAIVILIALVAAGILGYLALRQIVAPIEELAILARRVAGGQLTQKSSITRSDEIGTLAKAFNSMTSQLFDLIGSLEKRVEERTAELEKSNQQIQKRASQMEAIANTARSSVAAQNLGELLTTITRDVSSRFGFYHVGIFLVDENRQFAILSAANSDGGRRMLERGHRLRVGEQGIVGFVTSRGEPRIALDVGDDAVFFNNPDLPETHSEVALPLKFGSRIIGALDIQSKDANAFSQEDVEVFSILADQVSVAIQNARSLEQAQFAVQEAESASRQLTGQAWNEYSKRIRARGYRYDGIKTEALNEAQPPKDDKNGLLIPVRLRGQTIGRLKLKSSDESHKWTEDELAMIQATAERVAFALDGARLLTEAQKRATRETFLSELGTKLSTSFQLDSILRDTVEELGSSLNGSTVSFQLVNPGTQSGIESKGFDNPSSHQKISE